VATLFLLAAAACGGGGPPVWAPNPTRGGGASEACLHARALRERAPRLYAEGRLDRAARALGRAEDLCPMEAQPTWALRVRALSDLGRASEALQLAARIERSDRAGDADRAAAATARAAMEERARTTADRGSRRDDPELFDPADKRRTEAALVFRRAADASRAGDHAAAKKLFLDAWDKSHPEPRALVAAGLEANAEGHRAEAQALWDRAAYDDATTALRPLLVDGAPEFHAPPVIAWSHGSDRFAVSGDRIVFVFDVSLRPLLRLVARELVTSVAFAHDAGRVYVGLEGGAVQVFDALDGGAGRDLVGHRGAVRSLAPAPDGRRIATASDDGSVGVWDARGSSLVGWAPEPRAGARSPASLVAYDESGTVLAASDAEGRLCVYRVDDAGHAATCEALPARGGAVRAMAFTAHDELTVVTAGERVTYDVRAPKRARAKGAGRLRTESASVSTGARTVVATLGANALAVTDLGGKEEVASAAAAEHGGVVAFALAPSGAGLAVVYRDRALAILPALERRPRRELVPSGPVDALAASADGKTLIAASSGRAFVWRVAGERLRHLEPASVRTVACSPDGRLAAVGLENGGILVHDLEGKTPGYRFDTAGAVETLAFSPDGQRLVAGTAAPSVRVFSLAQNAEPSSLRIEVGPVKAARFSPDGASVLVASKDGVMSWRPSTHEGLRFVPYGPEVRDAAFTPDGMVVVSRRGELLFGKPLPTAPAPLHVVPVPMQAFAVATRPDGTLATAEGDRSIALRLPTGKAFHRFHDPDAAVRALVLLPSPVAAGLSDGTVRLYRAPATGPSAILRVAPGLGAGKLGGILSGPRGHLEIIGPDAEAARASMHCLLGAVVYPLDVCAEQFTVEGLYGMALAGVDPAEADP
jgi:WD40 repeat protein